MNLWLSEEQELLASSAEAVLAKEHDFQSRRRSGAAGDSALWPLFAQMGWLGQPLPESSGGFGGDALGTGLLLEAMGRHLVTQPFHACMVAARLLSGLGTSAQQQDWLPAMVEGRERLALAHEEAAFESPWAAPATRADRAGDGWVLHGRKLLVVGAPGARALLVTATVPRPHGGVRIFLVEPSAGGLSLMPCRTVDGLEAADVRLDGVQLGRHALVGSDTDATAVLHRVLAEGLVGACWDACGAMTAAYEQTVAYTRQRVQFGKPLAEFQAVAHRLAEMAVCCTEARAACELASLRLERGDDEDVVALAAMAKNKVGRCADFVAKEAVQLHGAIGTTEELPISFWFRRLMAFNARGGAPEWHARFLGQRHVSGKAWRESQTLPPARVTA
ncbi:acyl-CoA dehydrogenase family protein [Xenophilus azovorans]|uniref:acyl-CoA dehydrogenase family protein n=1 Tax=Xenophilus azovorans TaxID=151755 RepID=UPI00056DE02C|nr:acyl-CoA dehydrogenase [Xenophilus azovorans]